MRRDEPSGLLVCGVGGCVVGGWWLVVGGDDEVYPGAAHGVGHFGPHERTEQGAEINARVGRFFEKHLAPRRTEAETTVEAPSARGGDGAREAV